MIVVLSLVVVGAVSSQAVLSASGAEAWSGASASFTTVATPNADLPNGSIQAVACPSSSDCQAVGDYL
ncbi:MAG TPA: hypothetical protein VGS21_11860, partial [Acidimicrobiales bacterium]|nr:hypothetical protein [Acidimicrobiales bacterium]